MGNAKAHTIKGNWNGNAFDRRKGAKAATAGAANEGWDYAQGGLLGVAAE